jgi:prevent-host-death family protein
VILTTFSGMSEPDLVIPATEANRAFSKLLRAAREGRRVTITSHGEPVAELVPAGEAAKAVVERARRDAAQQELLAHLRTVKPIVAGPWTREELFERD